MNIFFKDILSAQNLPQVVPIVTSQSVITEITKGTGDKSFTKKEFISFAKKNKHLLTRLTEEVKKSFIVPMESFSKSALLVTLILSDTWKVSVSHEKQMYKKLDPSVVDNIILQSIIKPSFEDKYQLFHFGNSEHGHYDVLLLFAKSTLMDSSKSALLKTSDIMVRHLKQTDLIYFINILSL